VGPISRQSSSVGTACRAEVAERRRRDARQSELTQKGRTSRRRVGTYAEGSTLTRSVGARETRPGAESREPRAGTTTPPGASARAGFVLDLGRCVGCGACVLACRLENGWSSDNPWRRVLPLNLRRRPGGPTYFLSVACHHCGQPACVAACPSRAYEKRADGVVVHHAARCIGCRYCEMACPFGAPRYDASKGLMTKCDFCRHESTGRADRPGVAVEEAAAGRPSGVATAPPHTPACVAACPTEALRALTVAGGGDEPAVSTPGFADPAGCSPNIRFVSPRGARRASLLRALNERLGQR